jgi:predicted metalloprotease with PDZ domain
MKKNLFFGILASMLCTLSIAQQANLRYSIDLNERKDDTFKVTLQVDKLTDENDVYQFASTAPGTYQIMNLGRFVSDFKAFDKKGKEIETKNISVNQWKIENPKKVKTISYTIAETWDTPVEEYKIYKMCGTSIEDDHVLINAHCVFGYLTDMQSEPISIDLAYPENWKVGTALNTNEGGAYYATSYDHAVDSPILLGRLTTASTNLNGSSIEIYTYSKTDLISSEQLLASMTSMLKAAGEFVVNFPVDRYAFLYHFEDESWGAWEHSYSSEYVMKEEKYTPAFGQNITDIAAHEFFHVVTPLNIHSEIIQEFNFVTPTPSEHLWLYEGTTEWAAHMMQLRYGLISVDDYFKMLSNKLVTDSYFDSNYSLSKLALTSYTKDGYKQYNNIYMRGALVAGLLDIKLLELSGGKRGYREVINELSKKYGPTTPFSEKDFFKEFVAMTYPEIEDFFEQYVKNANPLPVSEYYGKLGISYSPKVKTGKQVATLGMHIGVPEGKFTFMKVNDELLKLGLQANDQLVAINGEEVIMENAQSIFVGLRKLEIGEEYKIMARRDDKEFEMTAQVYSQEKINKHVFKLMDDISNNQIELREAWLKNF